MNLNGINFEKIARILELDDVEDNMGMYFNDGLEPHVREAVNQQYAKRFALRHPWLTGIPTLGLAPAISKDRAVEEIKRNLVRKNSAILADYRAVEQARYQKYLMERELQIKSDKANAMANAASNLGSSYVAGKALERDR